MERFKKYLSNEIGIDFKACHYFFCMLFFYSMHKLLGGKWEIQIVITAEMICATYIMGYIQVYLLRNFDESEYFGIFEAGASFLCSVIYTAVSYAAWWFDRNGTVTGIFFLYVMVCYFCMFLAYKVKRDIDTKQLNADLEEFKKAALKEKTEERGKGI